MKTPLAEHPHERCTDPKTKLRAIKNTALFEIICSRMVDPMTRKMHSERSWSAAEIPAHPAFKTSWFLGAS